MFTGIVEETGAVLALDRSEAGARLTVRAPMVADGLQLGESVAVNGCCLTVAALVDGAPAFDLLAETLKRTNLGDLKPGSSVNLERAMSAAGRFGGHFVQGHVDCTSEIVAWEPVGADHRIEIALPPEFAQYVVFKGSIGLDGMSLTVAEVAERSFTVWIIPHTLAVTNLGTRRVGDRVNVEFDLLAKYVERMLQSGASVPLASSAMTKAKP
jgi:riboflavin synthase